MSPKEMKGVRTPGFSVSPGDVELYPSQVQKFTSDVPVTWSIVPDVGTITDGLYTAPSLTDISRDKRHGYHGDMVIIKATNVSNQSEIAVATVELK